MKRLATIALAARRQPRKPHFEIIRLQANGEWYLHIVAANGLILAHSESYTRVANAKKACRAINSMLPIKVIR